jgi:hypothetical protein
MDGRLMREGCRQTSKAVGRVVVIEANHEFVRLVTSDDAAERAAEPHGGKRRCQYGTNRSSVLAVALLEAR